jgi:pantetheine-phosphate adenylyltransferase
MSELVAIYPGSFDPITNGHLDLISRAAGMFSKVVVAITDNDQKHPLFPARQRRELAQTALRKIKNAEVDIFSGLLVDYARQKKARVLLRGLRAVSDFEYELQMALMNRTLSSRIETLFMTPRDSYTYLSSSLVKEIARHGGNVRPFVPRVVELALKKKYSRPKRG